MSQTQKKVAAEDEGLQQVDPFVALEGCIAALRAELAQLKRPIVDRRPGAGPATRVAIPYVGLQKNYADAGRQFVEAARQALSMATPGDDYELQCQVGETYALMLASQDLNDERIARLETLIDKNARAILGSNPYDKTEGDLDLIKSCIRKTARRLAKQGAPADPPATGGALWKIHGVAL